MSVNLAIYLMQLGTTIDNVIKKDKLTKQEYEQIAPAQSYELASPHRCYLKRPKSNNAGWGEWLGEAFDLNLKSLVNQNSGCVVTLLASKRVFAVVFGSGRHAIDPLKVEYDFGLRVALNKVNPEGLSHLVRKTVDIRSRENSTYHHAGGAIADFQVDIDSEWLRSVAGSSDKTKNTEFSAVTGSDAIRLVNYTKTFKTLRGLCSDLLAAYNEDVPEAFAFAKNVRPINQKTQLHKDLEAEFLRQVDSGDNKGIEIILDWSVVSQMSSARVMQGSLAHAVADLASSTVWDAIGVIRAASGRPTRRITIEVTDEVGKTSQHKAVDVMQAEVSLKGGTYLRIERRWFVVAPSYIAQVDERVRQLTNATTVLSLPTWSKTTHASEDEYNTATAKSKSWLLQDKQLVYPGSGAGVEPCDLLTEDGYFIHLKEGKSSSCVNHLLGQLGAAADLYFRHEPSRKEIQKRHAKKWPKSALSSQRPTFVAAVGRRQVRRELLGKMLVAKINLRDQARRVRTLGFDFAIAGFAVRE